MTMAQTQSSDSRWAAALDIARGMPDENAVRKKRTRVLLWIAALLVASWILGVVLAFVLPVHSHSDGSGDETSGSRIVAAFILEGVGLVVGVVGFIWARRTGRYITRWSSVSSPLNRREKKSAQKQINGKKPLEEEKLPVLIAIARQGRKVSVGLVPIYGGIALFALALALLSDSLYVRILEAISVACFLFVFGVLAVAYRRSGRFLARYA
jgi:hypothetical protein